MKTLNFNEMETVIAGGCGWMKRQAKRAEKAGNSSSAAAFRVMHYRCKRQ